MYVLKFIKILLSATLSISLIVSYQNIKRYDLSDESNSLDYVEKALLTSNRMTQPDNFSLDKIETYENEFKLPYNEEVLSELGYDYNIESDLFKLYFHSLSFSVVLYDKTNDYYISSRAEFQGITGTRENNTSTRNMMNSGLWISYVRKANVSTATEETDSIYSAADVKYVTDGSIKDEQDYKSVFEVKENSYDFDAVELNVNEVNQLLDITVNYKDLGFKLSVILSLNESGLNVQVPAEKIEENSNRFYLTKITLFPYFGSVREDSAPGYMVVPDGSGALIRFNKPIEETLKARFYGNDLGINSASGPYFSLPIAGLISNVGKEGFYARIEEGAASSKFEASFWSSNSKYQKFSIIHILRPIYKAIINQAGDGREQVPESINNIDFKMTFVILGQDSSYDGIALNYQNYLLENELINQKEYSDEMPMVLSLLMGDQTPAFLGTSYLEMTSSEEALQIIDYFRENSIQKLILEFYGWSLDGHVDETPYRIRKVNGLDNLISKIKEMDLPYYLFQDYIVGSSLSSRLIFNRDVSRNYSRLKMDYPIFSLNSQLVDLYYIYPKQSLAFSNNDELKNVSSPNMGNTLFSFFDGKFNSRYESLSFYNQIMSQFESQMLYRPSLYAWKYMDVYKNIPMMHSNYYYYTDAIPLVQLILKGIVPYFSEPLNFNALGDDAFLNMIDYGVYPNYVLTKEPTEKMRFTRSAFYFTTEFEVFKDDIINTYNMLNNVHKEVGNSKVVKRDVLDYGIVMVRYSNDYRVIINYSDIDYEYGTYIISSKSAEVIYD